MLHQETLTSPSEAFSVNVSQLTSSTASSRYAPLYVYLKANEHMALESLLRKSHDSNLTRSGLAAFQLCFTGPKSEINVERES